METRQYLDKLIAPIRRRIIGMISRAVVTEINDSLARQNLQIRIHADESMDNIERFQNYGFTSNPPKSAEAIPVAVAGNLADLVVLAVEDKNVRPKGGDDLDVCVYHAEGHNLKFTNDGKLLVTATDVVFEAANSLTIISPETLIQGPLHVTGGISTDLGIFATGGITSTSVVSGSDLTAGSISYLGHFHKDAENRNTSPPVS
ncbi:phage baseplate assembly protein V [Vibrio bivalvicida]|uniref:Phage baseplate assembly protein V n=1 Tax=Vibrio bivalvicida TaxID=1276888 RepID=A0ABV4MLJ7_9VIBR